MSLFGGGGLRSPAASAQPVNQGTPITSARTNLTKQRRLKLHQTNSSPLQNCSAGALLPSGHLADGAPRIQDSCHRKCINKKFYEGDLTTGEAVCLDRCVSKFFGTHTVMNEVLHANQNAVSDGIGLDVDSEPTAGRSIEYFRTLGGF